MASTDRSSQLQERDIEPAAVAEQAKRDAGRLSEVARKRTRSFVEDRKVRLAEGLGGVADAVRSTADRLDDQGNPAVAEYMHRAADSVQRFSDTMRDRDVGWIVGEVENFARRQPAVFIGTSVALGFVLARFLRSSAAHREAERYRSGSEGESSDGQQYGEGSLHGPSA